MGERPVRNRQVPLLAAYSSVVIGEVRGSTLLTKNDSETTDDEPNPRRSSVAATLDSPRPLLDSLSVPVKGDARGRTLHTAVRSETTDDDPATVGR